MPAMSYKLGVVSPSCVSGPKDSRVHIVPFELIGDQDLDNLSCVTCGKPISLSRHSEPQTVWLTCAYQVIYAYGFRLITDPQIVCYQTIVYNYC